LAVGGLIAMASSTAKKLNSRRFYFKRDTMHTKLNITIILLLALGLLVACGSAQPETGIPADAALKITGNVANEVGWTEESVKAMDTIETESTNKKGETKTYTGVALNNLLSMAQVSSGASTLKFVGGDGSVAEASLAEIQACQGCIVSFRNQGGFSMVLPDFDEKVQIKDIVEVQVQ
jgi:hypothetical protein